MDSDLRYSQILDAFYGNPVKTLKDGTVREIGFDCSVAAHQGRMLYDLVRLLKPTQSLEIGLAWGASAIHILSALEANGGGHHTAIDPMQDHVWAGLGISEPDRLGLGNCLTCLEERSDAAMPRLLADGSRFQFVFIDGDHRFDGAFVDFHYSRQLLDIGGIVVFDDAKGMSVGRVVSFVDTNMKSFSRVDVETFGRFAAFKKDGEDVRTFGEEYVF